MAHFKIASYSSDLWKPILDYHSPPINGQQSNWGVHSCDGTVPCYLSLTPSIHKLSKCDEISRDLTRHISVSLLSYETLYKCIPDQRNFEENISYFTINIVPAETQGVVTKSILFKFIIWSNIWGARCEIALRWMTKCLTNEKPTFFRVMARCHKATSDYLSQC